MPHILSPILGPSTDPGVVLGGITAPYRAHGFVSGHIPSSTPFEENFLLPSSGLNTSVHPHRGGSGYVNVGSTPYIPSYVPSSTALFLFNAVVMVNGLYISYRLDYLLIVSSSFGLILLSCKVHFLYTLSEALTHSCP